MDDTTPSIISAPFLQSVLSASILTRDQCVALLSLLEAHPTSPSTQLDISKHQKTLNTDLAQIRGSNRDATLRVRHTKHLTADARQEVDRLHLQLQNLYYKQRHLRGEITACEAYNHTFQQLPLLPEEDFLALHPEHLGADEDALMVARIEHEHREREELEQARQGLLKKKQGLIADNKKRKGDLAELDRNLETFIDAAKPIQKTFEKEY